MNTPLSVCPVCVSVCWAFPKLDEPLSCKSPRAGGRALGSLNLEGVEPDHERSDKALAYRFDDPS